MPDPSEYLRMTARTIRLRRVVSASTPGVASTNPPHGEPAPAQRTVFVDRVDRVLAARGDEAALSAEQSAQCRSVQDHKMNEQPLHFASRFCHSLCSLSINVPSSR